MVILSTLSSAALIVTLGGALALLQKGIRCALVYSEQKTVRMFCYYSKILK
jgi:hypothetical protein